jgi:DNA invertase Pin-like site-specific DNA recombinase
VRPVLRSLVFASQQSQNEDRTSENSGRGSGIRVVGYTSARGGASKAREELERQAELIAQDCGRRGLELIEVVHEREPVNGKALSRPGLAYALRRIANGEASALIVSELGRLTHSAAELGKVIEWLRQAMARLIVVAHGLDTGEDEGRRAANLLVEVSHWESERLSERTRSGLQAARSRRGSLGRPAVVDNPQLYERIAQMRAQGMTLQAIADRLNEEGVPTVRGGAKWRHSSVQAAAGYRRPSRVATEDPVAQPASDSAGPPRPPASCDGPEPSGCVAGFT